MTKPGSSKTPDNQLVDNSESLCWQCRKLVKNKNPEIECEICQQWYLICPVAQYIYASVPYSMWHTKWLVVIAGGNLCRGNNVNNNVLASDEMIFIGRISGCA